MSSRQNWLAMVFALSGAACCLAAILHFLFNIYTNRLDWVPDQIRDHYIVVGQSYAQGFVVGFFLCFSLALTAITLANWLERAQADQAR